MPSRPAARAAFSAIPWLLAATGAWADPQGTSTYVPVQIEDAYVVRLGEFELQSVARFDKNTHGSAGPDLWNLTPEVKFGATKNLELIVGTNYAAGNQSGANQGAGSFVALYNINPNTTYVPAFAVQVGYATPYGSGQKTATYTLKGIATKNLGPPDSSPRLDLNVIWTHRTQAEGSTRGDQLQFGVAYSMLIRSDTALVVDYVHGATSSKGKTENIVDVGFRHEVTSNLALSVGAGIGVGGDSPNYRFIFALQRSFQLF